MPIVSRRGFLAGAFTCAGVLRAQQNNQQAQTFLAGLAAGAPRTGRTQGGPPPRPVSRGPEARIENFWRACDDCSRLGVHYVEFNNTHRGIMEAYESRIGEYRDEMAKRGLTLLEFALYSHIHDTSKLQELAGYHLRLARFLKATGGKSIVHLLAPGPQLGNGDEESYRTMDVKAASANMNEVGKRVLQETGIRIGYHPEQGDIRAGVWERYLESTDERYFKFWPDVGHLVACGVNPLEVYRKHRARIIGTHFRDYAPPPEPSKDGRPARGRMVPFGTGIIDLPALAAHLREIRFEGAVMGEGGGNEGMAVYMAQSLKLKL